MPLEIDEIKIKCSKKLFLKALSNSYLRKKTIPSLPIVLSIRNLVPFKTIFNLSFIYPKQSHPNGDQKLENVKECVGSGEANGIFLNTKYDTKTV